MKIWKDSISSKTEAIPKGISVEQFCSRNKVPYNIFYKWYKDTRKKIVEVKVDDLPSPAQENPKEERHSQEALTEAKTSSVRLFEKTFVAGHQFMKVERESDERVYRIDWKDVILLLGNPIVKSLKVR